MAVTLEQVEKLRERADVSYEEAKQTLEQCGGDLLDALILLERRGKIRAGGGRGALFSTQPGVGTQPPPDAGPEAGQAPLEKERPKFWGLSLTGGDSHRKDREARSGFWSRLKELLLAALDLLRHCTVNQFEVWRGGELMTTMPILVLILLVLVAYWISLPLLLVGLFFGCKYRFSGPDLEQNKVGEAVNRASDKVRSAVGQMRDEFKKEYERVKRKKGR